MTTGIGFLTLALLGAAPPERDQIAYEVRIIETRADDWRGDLYRYCTRVGREGRSTVWTIEDANVKTLLKAVMARPESSVVQCPKPTAFADTEATVEARQARSFVVDLDRTADGPVDKASMLAYTPVVDRISEGVTFTVKGHREGSAIAAHIKLDSTWIAHVAEGKTKETIEDKARGRFTLAGKTSLPQVVESKIDGDYTIPEGRSLLISLGTATSVDGWNRPVVKERLALINARRIDLEAEDVRVIGLNVSAKTPSAMPALPSRSLLTAIGPDGKVVPPAIEVDEAVKPASFVGPEQPRPSPQSRLTLGLGMYGLEPPFIQPRPDTDRIHSLAIPIGGGFRILLTAESLKAAPKPD